MGHLRLWLGCMLAVWLLGSVNSHFVSASDPSPQRPQLTSTELVAACNTELLQFTQQLVNTSDCSNATLVRYLSRTYPACLDNATAMATGEQESLLKLLAPREVAPFVASLIDPVVEGFGIEPLVMGVQSSHMVMEVLSELSANYTGTAAGWILPHWAIERILLVLGVMPVLPAVQIPSLAVGGNELSDDSTSGRRRLQQQADSTPVAMGAPRRRRGLEVTDQLWLDEAQESETLVSGIPNLIQRLATRGGPSVLYVPLDGTVLLMYYRPDLLQARKLHVPATWDQLLSAAQMLNGTDMNEDGEPDYGFCIEPALDCSFSILAGAMLTSFTQYKGTAQGAYLDPDTLLPLFNTSAYTRTLSMVAQFAKLSPKFMHVSQTMLDTELLRLFYELVSSGSTAEWVDVLRRMRETGTMWNLEECPSYKHTLYQQGRCAFTLGTSHVWKTTQVMPPTHPAFADDEGLSRKNLSTWYAKGRMGITLAPGSDLVYDRATNELVPCTEELCAYGIDGTPEVVMAKLEDGSWGAQYVNRAPYSPVSGVVGAISARASREQQHAAAETLLALSGPLHNQIALSPRAPYIAPMRNELLTLDALDNYTAAGFNADDTRAYIEAANQVFNHPNVVPAPGIPGFPAIRHIMSSSVIKAAAGEEPADIAAWAHEEVLAHVLMYNPYHHQEEDDVFLTADGVVSAQTDSQDTFQMQVFHRQLAGQIVNTTAEYRLYAINTYRLAIGYWGQELEAVTALDTDRTLPVVSLAVPIICTIVTLVVTILYELRKHLQHKDLFGKVVAPGPYIETTLLVTDIESSTVLWEMLPPSVMDLTLHQHHACIRALLLKHCGYESATEGDSFILAFHCPEDALLFAMECQAALLDCSWPPELLQCEQCAPIYVVPIEKKRKHLAALDGMVDDLPHINDDVLDTMTNLIPTGSENPFEKSGIYTTNVTVELAPGEPSQPSPHGIKPEFDFQMPARTSKPSVTHALHERTSRANTHTVVVQPEGGAGVHFLTEEGEFMMSCGSHTQQTGAGTGTQGGQSTSSSPNSERTFLSEVKTGWKIATASTPGAVCIFRGLKVRMGCTSGVDSDADVLYNKAAARTHYGGRILTAAKAVADAAGGGCVLLTQSCYALLPMASLWDKALVMHVGEYELHDGEFRMHLYQVLGRRLLGRLANLDTCVARCSRIISRGVLAAPLGHVAVAHTQAVGAMTLLAWNQSAARKALTIFFEEAEHAVASMNGAYMAEAQVDQIAIVFVHASEAIVWGLLLHKALLEADWPPELCEHELCEEVCVNGVVMFRGMRVKVGIDCGEVMGEVDPLTGRCSYTGRPVTRSQRVMQTATSNQVLCTSQAWANANQPHSINTILQHRVTAEPLGLFKLKGMLDRTELLQCRLASEPLVNKRRASTLCSSYMPDFYPQSVTD